jgi:hypothetical protein
MIIKHSDAKIDSVYTDKKTAQEDIEKKTATDVTETKEEKKSAERN